MLFSLLSLTHDIFRESDCKGVLTSCTEYSECLVQSLGLGDSVCTSGNKDVLFSRLLIPWASVLLGLLLKRELGADGHVVDWPSAAQKILARHDKEVVGLKKEVFIGLLMRLYLVHDEVSHLLVANSTIDVCTVSAFVPLEISQDVLRKGYRVGVLKERTLVKV